MQRCKKIHINRDLYLLLVNHRILRNVYYDNGSKSLQKILFFHLKVNMLNVRQ